MSTDEEKHRLTVEIDPSTNKKLQILATWARRSKTKHIVQMIEDQYKSVFGDQHPDQVTPNGG